MESILIHLLLLISPIFGYGTWTTGTNKLPTANSQMAGGQDINGTVYLIGGWNSGYTTLKALVSFKDGSFSNLGDATNRNTFGYGQYYSQLNENLWMIRYYDYAGRGTSINRFDTNTLQMNLEYSLIPSGDGARDGCLVSIDLDSGYLITTGGYSASSVLILDLGDLQWTTATSMNGGRSRHTCNSMGELVYVFGGYASGYLDSIEMASFSDLLSATDGAWTTLSAKLLDPLGLTRSVVHLSDILIVAGTTGSGSHTEVNVFDTLTNTVSSGGNLNYGVMCPVAIIVDDVLYVIGGQGYTDNYQYLPLPTASPTLPSMDPTTARPTGTTSEPTSNPTVNPSMPTSEPTANPTRLYTYIGCYGDADTRALPYGSGGYGYDVPLCSIFCNDYRYFGLQNGGQDGAQCWCGNDGQSAFQYGESTACPANRLGAGWANDIFMHFGFPTIDPTSEPTSDPTQPSVAPSTPVPTMPTSNPTSDPTPFPSELTANPTTNPTSDPTTAAPTIAYGPWTVGTNSLAFATSRSAAAHGDNGTIYLLGGYSSTTKSLMSFKNGEFTSYGLEYFSNIIWGGYQYYSQLNDDLWMLDGGRFIIKFNIPTLQATFYYGNGQIPGDYAQYGCITTVDADDGYLVISGGVRSSDGAKLDTVYLFDLGTSGWITTGSLNVGRRDLSCESINGFVYVLGGSSDNAARLDSIEKASFNDLLAQSSSSWNELSSTLTIPMMGLSAIHLDEILMVGRDISGNTYLNIINTITDKVRAGPRPLYQLNYPCIIAADGVLYAFGGLDYSSSAYPPIDTYQYLVLPTASPTYDPTSEPTSDPTANPTTLPTYVPTSDPTSDPTPVPVIPTLDPTSVPTQVPIIRPTSDPTTDPTDDPTEQCVDVPLAQCPGTSFTCSCETCYGCDPNGVACNCYNCGCFTKCPDQPPCKLTDDPTNEPTNEPTLEPTIFEVAASSTLETTLESTDVVNEDTDAGSTPSPVDDTNSDSAVIHFEKVVIVWVVLMAIFISF